MAADDSDKILELSATGTWQGSHSHCIPVPALTAEKLQKITLASVTGAVVPFQITIALDLSGSLPKSSLLDFMTKNNFSIFFVGEEALVDIY